MKRAGIDRVVAAFEMCLDDEGAVTRVQTLESSGYPAYDEHLRSGIETWRYRPFEKEGKPVPVCTVVTFIYKQGNE